MLEKLLGAGFFGDSIDHLAHHQVTFPTSLNEFSLPYVVWIVAPTFLGCWALIVLAFVIHFQYGDHHILIDVITHVETNTSPFQMAI